MAIDKNATYYDAGGIETIKIIRAKLSPEMFVGYCVGNAIKYLCRAFHKGNATKDILKANTYLTILLEEVNIITTRKGENDVQDNPN